jgi:hypothetical protein
MAAVDDGTEETLTVVDEIEQEPMEVTEAEVTKEAEKKKKREEEEEDYDEEIDEELANQLQTDPRLHLIAGSFLYRDLCNLKEIRTIIRQCDHFEVRFFKTGLPPRATPAEAPPANETTEEKSDKEEKDKDNEEKDKDKEENKDKEQKKEKEEKKDKEEKIETRRGKKGYARFTFNSPSMAFWVLDNLRGMQIPRIRSINLKCWMLDKETAHQILHQSPDKIGEVKRRLLEVQDQDVSHRALYFSNLPKTVNEEKLKEFVPEAKEIHLPIYRGSPRGYAYVEFESKEAAEEALTNYKGKKMDTNVVGVRKIGSGKAAHLLASAEAAGTMRGGRMRGSTRGMLRRRSPPRGGPRRYQGPIWDTWGRDDRKRRFPSEREYFAGGKFPRDRNFGRREPFRRERMDDWERDFRRDYRDRFSGYDDMRFGMREEYMGRAYDRGGYGDGWISGGAFSRPPY